MGAHMKAGHFSHLQKDGTPGGIEKTSQRKEKARAKGS